MAMKFKKGDSVQQLVAPIRGVVMGAQVVDGDHVQYLVQHTDANGEATQTWFKEEHLGADPKAKAEE